MRFLLIHRLVHQDPLGILYLGAALREAGHDVRVIDAALEPNAVERAVEYCPAAVGYSVMTGSQGFFCELNRQLKERASFVSVFGGPHPTFFPEFIEEEGVDVICVGEGEGAVVDLADAIELGAPFDAVPNLHVKTPSGVVRNDLRPLREDLDELPFPDRSLLDRYPQYRCVGARAVMASRGCPHGCAFCFNTSYRKLYSGKGRYSRVRSVESIIRECRRHRADPWATHIHFKDDLFAHDEAFVHEFAERYRREVGLPFVCNVRADRMTEGIAEDLALAGARTVNFGVEAGADRVRYDILKRKISREAMRSTVRWLRERGIQVYTFNIIGIPDETPEEALETLELNAELAPDVAAFTLFQPYPRTALGDRAIELGWRDPGYGGYSHTYYGVSMARMPHARRYRNMMHLFPLAVRSRLLRRLVPTLSRIPATPLYAAAGFAYKATRFVFTLGYVSLQDVAVYSGHYVPKAPPRRPVRGVACGVGGP